MSILADFPAAIGHTPLIRLKRASELTGCEILGKVEFARAPIDLAWSIPDAESVPLLHALLIEEGWNVGGSSGVNLAGAIRLARELGPGHVIVTVLVDPGTRYQAKLFNPPFLAERGIPVPDWLRPA